VQEYETAAIGIEKKVIKIVLCIGQVIVGIGDSRSIFNGNNQLAFAAFQINTVNAALRRGQSVLEGVRGPRITIPRSHIINSTKIKGDCCATIRTNRINGMGNGPHLSRAYIENAANKLVPFPVVPDNLRLRTGYPLQHTALLPVPGSCISQPDPTVIVLKVNHPYFDAIFGSWRSAFESNPHAQHISIMGIELQLVVIPEPVVSRSAGDRS